MNTKAKEFIEALKDNLEDIKNSKQLSLEDKNILTKATENNISRLQKFLHIGNYCED